MIKIQINSKVEDLHWDDMKKNSTGLLQVLKTVNAMTLLRSKKEYRKLYYYFYDCSGNVKEENVKKLLLSNKAMMENYIDVFGKFEEQEAKELGDKIFRYDTFSTRKHAYRFLEEINVNVCPYCNRQYTVTLKSHKARPQFDHYYPKSIYPYLAVTLYNLVPSCGICNQEKSALDTKDTPILYPYEEEFGDDVRFKTINKSVKAIYGLSNEFDVKIAIDPSVPFEKRKKIETQSETLYLEELYNMHKDYIMDIAKNHYVNSIDRIDELLKQFPQLFSSKEELKCILRMNDTRKENWGKRPLAKLTNDILEELEKGV